MSAKSNSMPRGCAGNLDKTGKPWEIDAAQKICKTFLPMRDQTACFFVWNREERSIAMEDGAIIELYWDRDQEAIAQSEKKYGTYCRSIANGILRCWEDTEECVSDVWMRAWNSIPPQRPSRLSAFFGRIARNLAMDRWRYNGAEKRTAHFDLLLSELTECIPSTRDGIGGLELTELLNQFLRGQSQNARKIFLRRYWYADSIEEIAQQYRMTQSAVKSSLMRTRRKLQIFLEKEGIAVG